MRAERLWQARQFWLGIAVENRVWVLGANLGAVLGAVFGEVACALEFTLEFTLKFGAEFAFLLAKNGESKKFSSKFEAL